MRIRHIKTEVRDGRALPVLDANGQDIELWSVEVPREIASAGIPASVDQTSKESIEAYISAEMARRRGATEPVPAPATEPAPEPEPVPAEPSADPEE